MLAKILNSTVITYPYSWADFVADNNNTNYPPGTDMFTLFPHTDVAKGGFQLIEIATVPQPSYSPDTQTCIEGTPTLVNSVWTQTWNVSDMTLSAAQAGRIATLTAACNAAILGGYTSSALGSAHTYPSTPTDQMNMNVAVTASILPGTSSTWTTPFWCADSTGTWNMVEHTVAQIQQAGLDGKVAIQAARVKLATLVGQVQASTTVAEVQAVTW